MINLLHSSCHLPFTFETYLLCSPFHCVAWGKDYHDHDDDDVVDDDDDNDDDSDDDDDDVDDDLARSCSSLSRPQSSPPEKATLFHSMLLPCPGIKDSWFLR